MFNKSQSIKETLKNHIQESVDVVNKEFYSNDKQLAALYIKTISDETVIQNLVIKPFFEISRPEEYLAYLQSNPKIKRYEDEKQTLEESITGSAIFFYQKSVFLFDSRVESISTAQETMTETTIQGPHSAFSESLAVNIGLIRKRYPVTSIRIEFNTVGTLSKQK
jgi:hypothetical protein